MVILILTVGPRRALSTMKTYPAIVLTSCFSFFTVGPVATASSCSAHFNGERRKIRISFFHTWINVIITFAFMFIMPSASSMDFFRSGYDIDDYDFLLRLISLTSVPILLLGGVLPLILIQLLDNCACCCSSCCLTNCYPIRVATQIHIDDIDQLQEVEAVTYQQKITTTDPGMMLSYKQNHFDSPTETFAYCQEMAESATFSSDSEAKVTLLSYKELPFDINK